jgi:hypothetical protein
MRPTLMSIVEDFGRLWDVQGFGPLLAWRMAEPPRRLDRDTDPCGLVLQEHRRLLIAALKRAQQRPETSDLGALADALLGLYLMRRLRGDRLDGWADDAIRVVLGRADPYALGDA